MRWSHFTSYTHFIYNEAQLEQQLNCTTKWRCCSSHRRKRCEWQRGNQKEKNRWWGIRLCASLVPSWSTYRVKWQWPIPPGLTRTDTIHLHYIWKQNNIMLNKFKIMNDKYLAFTQDFSLNISRLDYFRFLSMSTLVIHDAPTSRVEIKPQLLPMPLLHGCLCKFDLIVRMLIQQPPHCC